VIILTGKRRRDVEPDSTPAQGIMYYFLPLDATQSAVMRLYAVCPSVTLNCLILVTWTNFSEYRMFWYELLQRRHGQSVPPTSAEISTGCQSISVSSTNYLYWHIKHSTQDSRVICRLTWSL